MVVEILESNLPDSDLDPVWRIVAFTETDKT